MILCIVEIFFFFSVISSVFLKGQCGGLITSMEKQQELVSFSKNKTPDESRLLDINRPPAESCWWVITRWTAHWKLVLSEGSYGLVTLTPK